MNLTGETPPLVEQLMMIKRMQVSNIMLNVSYARFKAKKLIYHNGHRVRFFCVVLRMKKLNLMEQIPDFYEWGNIGIDIHIDFFCLYM